MKNLFLLCFGIMFFTFIIGCGDDSSDSPSTPVPHAGFTVTGEMVTPAEVEFTNSSINADTYNWDFGNGLTSIQANPSITYETHGDYVVTLVATQTSTSHTDTFRQTLTITPGMVFLDSVKVEQIPFTDSQGAGWDLTTGPDLMFELVTGSNVINSSTYYEDLTPQDLPVGWYYSAEYRITNWTSPYSIDLYDYDATGNDYMGSVSFSVNGIIGQHNYQPHIILSNSAQSVRVSIALRWQ